MLIPRKVSQQAAQLPADLAAERDSVARLFNPCHKGTGQSQEYIAAAKALNAKLRAAGFTSLLVLED